MKNNYNAILNREQRHKPLTAAQAQKILKNGGTDVTVEEAEKILEFLRPLARIALDSAMESAERGRRLENELDGFLFEKAGYTCRICGHSAYNGWYDRNGLAVFLMPTGYQRPDHPGNDLWFQRPLLHRIRSSRNI